MSIEYSYTSTSCYDNKGISCSKYDEINKRIPPIVKLFLKRVEQKRTPRHAHCIKLSRI